jgi:hypothetical protein
LEFDMNITRRAATVGGLSVLAGTSMSTVARAEFGEGLRDVAEGLDDFLVAQDASDRWATSSSCGNIRTRHFET